MESEDRPRRERTHDEIRALNSALVDLVYQELPLRYYGGESHWSIASGGLIVRMAGTVENITRLLPSAHQLDSLVLLRALFEHVVTYCWSAIDHEERFARWVENAEASQLKMHNDVVQYGITILTDQEAKDAQGSRTMPDVAQRALEVDRWWSERVRGFRGGARDVLSLRGLYPGIYRVASRAVHVEPHTIDPYARDELKTYPHVIELPSVTGRFWCEVAGPIFGLALLASNYRFNWPDADRVRKLVESAYPKPDDGAPDGTPPE